MIEIALEHPEEKKKYGRLNNFENAQDRPETLVTIVQSAIDDFFEISNEVFTRAFRPFGEILIPTRYQNHRNTTLLNGTFNVFWYV